MCCHHSWVELSKSLKYMRIQQNLLFSSPDKENSWSFTSLAAKYRSVREQITPKLLHHQELRLHTGLCSTFTTQHILKASHELEDALTQHWATVGHTRHSDTQQHLEKRYSLRATGRLSIGEVPTCKETPTSVIWTKMPMHWEHNGSFKHWASKHGAQNAEDQPWNLVPGGVEPTAGAVCCVTARLAAVGSGPSLCHQHRQACRALLCPQPVPARLTEMLTLMAIAKQCNQSLNEVYESEPTLGGSTTWLGMESICKRYLQK